jgi:hypothetical protein
MTDRTSHPTLPTVPTVPTKLRPLRPLQRVENTTDSTRGEPLALRAQKRKAELERALEKLPAEDARARSDINIAVSSIDGLLTGDVEHLSDATAAELNRLLENSKHLAEVNPTPRSR